MTNEDKELHQKKNDKQVLQKEEEDIHKGKHPVPAPRTQKQSPPSSEKKSPFLEETGRSSCVKEPHQNTPEHRQPGLSQTPPRSDSDNESSQTLIDSRKGHAPLSRSGPVTSSGPYNVENTKKSKDLNKLSGDATPRSVRDDFHNVKPKRKDSEDSSSDGSTGTYNVESPKISKNIHDPSKADVANYVKSSDSKSMNSEAAPGTSERTFKHKTSPSASLKSKSSAQGREGTSRSPEEGTSTAHSHLRGPPPPHHKVQILSIHVCFDKNYKLQY